MARTKTGDDRCHGQEDKAKSCQHGRRDRFRQAVAQIGQRQHGNHQHGPLPPAPHHLAADKSRTAQRKGRHHQAFGNGPNDVGAEPHWHYPADQGIHPRINKHKASGCKKRRHKGCPVRPVGIEAEQ